jgi:hypothetical protein
MDRRSIEWQIQKLVLDIIASFIVEMTVPIPVVKN